jgi:RHS repeat-associated protein
VRPQTSQTYYHRNQQYSIVGLTNAAGTLVERYTYSAYGTLGIYAANGTARSSSTYANRYTYTGREWDAELRLYHFRARWYDPATGGFVTRDPLGYVDGMSLYRGYFGVRGLDPDGSMSFVPKDEGVLVAEGPDGNVRRRVYRDSSGNCYETRGHMLRTQVPCRTEATSMLYNLGDSLLEETGIVYKGLKRNEEAVGPFGSYHGLPKDGNPIDMMKDIAINQCTTDGSTCMSVMVVMAHGNFGNTCDGTVPFDTIAEFFGQILYCRPCYILLNSCNTGGNPPDKSDYRNQKIPYAARVAQVTGCTVFAPYSKVVGFLLDPAGTAYLTREGKVIARARENGAIDCVRMFRPEDYPCKN